jgi:hypothetical protein
MSDFLERLTYRRFDEVLGETYVGIVGGGPYHVIPGGRFWDQAQAMAAQMGDDLPFEPGPPAPTAEEILAAERAQMNPFAAAFWQAMKQVPATGFAHLLDRVEQTIAAARAVDPYAGIVLWADKVTQVVRAHPDMDAFRVQFGASETELDDLFRLALQIEAGA